MTVEELARAHQGPVAALIPVILDFMASRVEDTPMASIAKVVIAELRAFPEIGRFYLKEVIGRGIPIFEGLIARGVDSGEFRKVDPMLTVRSLIGPMLLSVIWKTVFEPIGAEKLDARALARHHADLMLHALRPTNETHRADPPGCRARRGRVSTGARPPPCPRSVSATKRAAISAMSKAKPA